MLAGLFVPYLVARAATPRDEVYVGLAAWSADQLSYLMWMRQAREGGPCYDLMTADPHPPVTPPLFWLALGKVSRLTGLTVNGTYHAARLVLAAAYLWLLWRVLGLWVRDQAIRLALYAAVAGGSGLGWLVRLGPAHAMPIDQAMPELWSFSSMLYYPHFTASLLLLAAAMYMLYQLWWAKSGRPVAWWLALACTALVLAAVHPYTFVPLAATLVSFIFVPTSYARSSRAARVAAAAALVPGAAYLVHMKIVALHHPVLRQWMEQNVLPSPPIFEYILGFGVAGIAALIIIVADLAMALSRDRERAEALGTPLMTPQRPDPAAAFAFVWALAAFWLAYAFPMVPFARRCMEGAHVFICILAAAALGSRIQLLARRKGLWAVAAVTALVTWPMSAILAVDAAGPEAIRVSRDVAGVWRFIEQALPPDAAIFCRATDGQFIPAVVGRRVFVGHFHLTPHFKTRMRAAAKFFSPSVDNAWRRQVLAESHCGYVLAHGAPGAVARALRELCGEPIFARGDVELFDARGAVSPKPGGGESSE